jgi:hypothetical protein
MSGKEIVMSGKEVVNYQILWNKTTLNCWKCTWTMTEGMSSARRSGGHASRKLSMSWIIFSIFLLMPIRGSS